VERKPTSITRSQGRTHRTSRSGRRRSRSTRAARPAARRPSPRHSSPVASSAPVNRDHTRNRRARSRRPRPGRITLNTPGRPGLGAMADQLAAHQRLKSRVRPDHVTPIKRSASLRLGRYDPARSSSLSSGAPSIHPPLHIGQPVPAVEANRDLVAHTIQQKLSHTGPSKTPAASRATASCPVQNQQHQAAAAHSPSLTLSGSGMPRAPPL
jgi:hypothetical protein